MLEKQEHFEEAEKYYILSIEHMEQTCNAVNNMKSAYELAMSYVFMGELTSSQERYKEARVYYEKAKCCVEKWGRVAKEFQSIYNIILSNLKELNKEVGY